MIDEGIRDRMFSREMEMIEALVNPSIVLARGYLIMTTGPSAINSWRRLYGPGKVPRPLSWILAAEEAIRRS